jgi:hypothetical protein
MSIESFENDTRSTVTDTAEMGRPSASPFFLGAIGMIVALVAIAAGVAFLS